MNEQTEMQNETEEEESWDLIIVPETGLFDLKLKELWRYRDLLWLWVSREYVGTYKQTIMGAWWHFFSPIFGTVIYMFVFGRVAKLSTGGVPMFLFYNAGIAIWNFFNGCFSSGSTAFSKNAGIFGKVYFPRLIMPIAGIVSSLIKFGIQISFFLVIYFYFILAKGYHPHVGWGLCYIPFSLLLFAGTGFGFGILISSVSTKYRDINMLVGFAMQLLMYATPIIYSYATLAPQMKHYLSFNPLVAPAEAFKYAVFGNGEFSAGSLLYSSCWMLVLLFVGVVLFNRAEKNFMDTV
jgi:lipopolysaccharide transport system permease protein